MKVTSKVCPSGMTATTDLSKHATLGKKIESAFYLAAQKFPYWGVEFSGLVPVIVDPPKGMHDDFTLAVTEDWIVLVSTRVLDLKWSNIELATVLAHELMHLWQRHSKRAKAAGIDRKDPEQAQRWNVAADCEINDDLRDAGCEFPRRPDGSTSGVFPESIGAPLYLTAEEYYAALLKEDEAGGDKGKTGRGDGKDGKGKPAPGKGGGKREPLNPDGCGSGSGGASSVEEELGLGEDPKEGDEEGLASLGKSEDEAEAITERMNDDLDRACADSKLAGRVPKGLALEVANRRKKSTIDWRAQLQHVVRRSIEQVKGSRQSNWSRLSRRTMGKFLQPTHTDPKVKVWVVMDTSASMVHLLETALIQVRAVLDAARAEVVWVQCDATIAEVATLKTEAAIDRITIKGGGGTSFCPPFALADKAPNKDKPQVLVYISDGYGDAPRTAPNYKVIWALLGGDRAPANWGTSVHIPREG